MYYVCKHINIAQVEKKVKVMEKHISVKVKGEYKKYDLMFRIGKKA